MPITCGASIDGGKVNIDIRGRFDYRLTQEFRETYRNTPLKEGVEYHVDLSGAEYMDSSALGMLLLLREHAKCHGGIVVIEKPSEQIRKILKVANFEQLFAINYAPSRLAGV